MTVSIGSNTKLNTIAGITSVLKITNSEKISLASKVLPPNVLVQDEAGILYMSDGVNTIADLKPIEMTATVDSDGNNIINTYATKSELSKKADDSDLTDHTGNTDIHVTANDKSNWNAKQDALTIETDLNKNSTNLLTNGAITAALEDKLDVTGIAASATKLETSRSINGTAFNGTSAITTAKWGTSRTITVTDNTATHSTTTEVDGSANFTLKLPDTIDADITGNAATATTATDFAAGGTIESALNDKVASSALNTHTSNNVAHCTQAEKNAWNAKQTALNADQLAAVNSGITSTRVGVYDGYASQIAAKVNTADVEEMISSAVADINSVEMVTAASFAALPSQGKVGTFYLVRNTASSGNNLYTEYIWTGTEYEETGANVDLKDYVTNSTLTTELGKKQNNLTTLQQEAVDSGINSAKVSKYDGYESTIAGITSANNSTITIKKNGTKVNSFTTNSSTNVDVNISVPTKVSDLTNDKGFISAHPAVSTIADTTSEATPAHGGSFNVVDGVTRDSFGHVTKINVKTITLPADNNTDTLVNQNVSSTNNTYPVLLTPTANASSNQGAKAAIFASGVKVNPNTNTVSATGFVGDLTGNVTGNVSGSSGSCTGNAATATKATNNANGKALTDTIIKGLSVSGKTITYTMIDGTTGTITTQDTNTWTAFKGATASANGTAGYVPAPTKGNQDKFFKADGTWATPPNTTYSFTNSAPTLAWGTTSTIGTVGGVDLTVTMPANPDTHWTTTLYAGAKDAKSNAVTTNGNAYIKLFDNNIIRSQLNIKGSGATTVTTDANGVITISSTDKNTTYSVATTSANGLMSAADKTKLNGLSNYTLPTAGANLGGVKTTSSVTSTSGLTACPIISGVPYYKDTNTTYSAMSAAEATTGTATSARSISAKVLHDKISEMLPVKAIVGITRSGTTFTYTCVDGSTGTFTQRDNNTTYSAMTAAEATTGTATTSRSITAKVLHDKINSMVPGAMTSSDVSTLLAQKLSPTPTRDGAMWMDTNYTMFVNEYNKV